MIESTKGKPRRRPRTKLINRIDALLEKRDELLARKLWALGNYNDTVNPVIKAAEERLKVELGDTEHHLAEVDRELAAQVKRHHYWLFGLYTKTVRRPFGVITERFNSPVVDHPKNMEAAVAVVDARPEWAEFLIVKKSLNLTTLQSAPPELRKELKRHGFWWGRMRIFSVKSPRNDQLTRLAMTRDTPASELDGADAAPKQ